jgi:hypothetical protein
MRTLGQHGTFEASSAAQFFFFGALLFSVDALRFRRFLCRTHDIVAVGRERGRPGPALSVGLTSFFETNTAKIDGIFVLRFIHCSNDEGIHSNEKARPVFARTDAG